MRVATSGARGWGNEEAADFTWDNSPNEEEYYEVPQDWLDKHRFETPGGRERYDRGLGVTEDHISLKDQTL